MIKKGDNFKRIATKRTNEILKRIRILGNCSNRAAYEYSEEEVEKIFETIEGALDETKARFHFFKQRNFTL